MSDKQRIIELQRQVRIARTALEKIHGHCEPFRAYAIAEQALDDMRPHDKTVPLAGLMGWEGRRP